MLKLRQSVTHTFLVIQCLAVMLLSSGGLFRVWFGFCLVFFWWGSYFFFIRTSILIHHYVTQDNLMPLQAVLITHSAVVAITSKTPQTHKKTTNQPKNKQPNTPPPAPPKPKTNQQTNPSQKPHSISLQVGVEPLVAWWLSLCGKQCSCFPYFHPADTSVAHP